MKYYEYCPYDDSNLECEYCKVQVCQLKENQYFTGYYITKQYICQTDIMAKEIDKALILENGDCFFEGIENLFSLITDAIESIVGRNHCSKSNYIVQRGRKGYCFNRICEEGEYSSFTISEWSEMSILNKYVNKVIRKNLMSEPIVTNEKVLNLIIEKEAERYYISEKDYNQVYNYIRSSINMIYDMVSCRYNYLQLF